MDDFTLLSKCILLLYREGQLSAEVKEYSGDLVKTVITFIKIPEVIAFGASERDVVFKLKAVVTSLCETEAKDEINKSNLISDIRVSIGQTDDYSKFLDSLIMSLNEDMTESGLKKSIVSLRKALTNYYKESGFKELITKAFFEISNKRERVKLPELIAKLTLQMEAYQSTTVANDPAVMDELDIGDISKAVGLYEAAKAEDDPKYIMRLGWKAVNRMTQHGVRRGSTTCLLGLQHKYKTGMSLTVFAQLAQYNKPVMTDVTKKPLLLHISFENPLTINLQFLYLQLKYTETGEMVDTANVTAEEMATYVRTKLQVNGYHIKMRRVDPTQWTYKDLFNYIIELESQGYEIHGLMTDYLNMLPTTGCIATGALGADKRDLFRRVRNFTAAKNIAFITPHQLSTEAKNLLRLEVNEVNFVKNVAEKGFYADSKQIDNEVDLEIYMHLFKHNKKTYLALMRGKHRLPGVIADEDKFCIFEFPYKMPIPDDEDTDHDISMTRLPSSTAVDDLINF